MSFIISKVRINEILAKYKTNKDLFNWCDEYNAFLDTQIIKCVSSEVDYMLKMSYTDSDSPLSYEDLDLFDSDKAREYLIFQKEHKEILFTDEDINEMSKENLKELFNKYDFDINEANAEVYEWWVLNDRLTYYLERQGEIFLNGFWGRCCTGQSIKLDSCVINAFIEMLEDWKQ